VEGGFAVEDAAGEPGERGAVAPSPVSPNLAPGTVADVLGGAIGHGIECTVLQEVDTQVDCPVESPLLSYRPAALAQSGLLVSSRYSGGGGRVGLFRWRRPGGDGPRSRRWPRALVFRDPLGSSAMIPASLTFATHPVLTGRVLNCRGPTFVLGPPSARHIDKYACTGVTVAHPRRHLVGNSSSCTGCESAPLTSVSARRSAMVDGTRSFRRCGPSAEISDSYRRRDVRCFRSGFDRSRPDARRASTGAARSVRIARSCDVYARHQTGTAKPGRFAGSEGH
jgi:hypothetical protein